MDDTKNELPAEVLRGLIKGWALSLPEHPAWDWLRAEMESVAGGAAAVALEDARNERGTRSVQRVDGRHNLRAEYDATVKRYHDTGTVQAHEAMLAAFAVLSNASRGELPPIAKLRDAGESGVEQH
jgi:hypothetical protein